jgi:CheY-like chemotaxis protein
LGLQLAESMKPDIILLDLMMPEMNGDEMLEKLRKTDWGKDIKVIILTNMGEQEAPESIKQQNVRRFIVKAEMTPRQVAEMVKTELAA